MSAGSGERESAIPKNKDIRIIVQCFPSYLTWIKPSHATGAKPSNPIQSQNCSHVYFVSEINLSYDANIADRKLDLA